MCREIGRLRKGDGKCEVMQRRVEGRIKWIERGGKGKGGVCWESRRTGVHGKGGEVASWRKREGRAQEEDRCEEESVKCEEWTKSVKGEGKC